LTPLYRLRPGEPGQSHAIEIAKRYGLPDSIIDSARGLLGGVKAELDCLIRDLTEKRSFYEKAIEDVGRKEEEIGLKARQLEEFESSVRRERDALLSKAYADAADLAANIKREMHELLETAKKAEKEKVREALKAVDEKKRQLETARTEFEPEEKPALSIDDIKAGDIVHIKSIDAEAEVVEIDRKHDRIRVKRGSVEVEVPFIGIYKGKRRLVEGRSERVAVQMSETDDRTSSSINVIGKRVDAALMEIEPFLNRAAMTGMRQIAIIHGVGTGILMKAVKEHLTAHPLVENFQSEEQHRGGRGVTIVSLK
jgi:DNA mismatch repair protein MutS2